MKTRIIEKEEQSQKIKAQTEEFLAKGGKIYKAERHESGVESPKYMSYNNNAKFRKKAEKSGNVKTAGSGYTASRYESTSF